LLWVARIVCSRKGRATVRRTHTTNNNAASGSAATDVDAIPPDRITTRRLLPRALRQFLIGAGIVIAAALVLLIGLLGYLFLAV